jgi:ABC-type sugar transport system substrate-binding protein
MNRRLRACTFLSIAAAILALSCKRPAPAKPLIGVAAQGAGGAFASACLAAVEQGAEGRTELAVMDGRGERVEQLAQVDRLIERKAASLIAVAVSASDAAWIIAAAKAKNVPLVLVGEQPSIEDLRSWDKVLYVGHSAAEAGKAQGEILAAAWKFRPAADVNRDGRMRLVFTGSPSDESRQACLDALAAAGVAADLIEARGASALAALAQPPAGARVEAVAAADPGSAKAAVAALEAVGRMKGRERVPVIAMELGMPAPQLGELEAAGLAGAVTGNPAAVGAAAIDAAYALAFRRNPLDAGFTVADGKYVIVPCAADLSIDFKIASK